MIITDDEKKIQFFNYIKILLAQKKEKKRYIEL